MVILSGAATGAAEELGGQTPLETAHAPVIRRLAEAGRVGGVVTIPPESTESPTVALASLLGVDTHETPAPAGPALARRLGVELAPSEIAWRLLLRASAAPAAGLAPGAWPSPEETESLIEAIGNLADQAGVRLVPGGPAWGVAITSDEHERRAAEFSDAASGALRDHEVNSVRAAAELPELDHPLLDEPGPRLALSPLREQHGVSAALVTGDEASLGLAEALAMTPIRVRSEPPAEPRDLASSATKALDDHDLVVVRTVATRLLRDAADLVALADAVTDLDEHLLAPLLQRLEREGSAEDGGGPGWRLLIATDLGPPDDRRVRPAPFLLAGDWVRAVVRRPFTEDAAEESDLVIDPGCDLLEYALRSGLKTPPPRPVRRSIHRNGHR
jgi:2,3-bisphosphoglycerate-independent phosphoglycerate mutase